MRKSISTLLLMTAAVIASAQITLNSSNFPSITTFYQSSIGISPIPAAGANSMWNYGTQTPTGGPSLVLYKTPTDPTFTSVSDAYYDSSFLTISPSLGLGLYNSPYFKTDVTSYREVGYSIPYLGYSLAAFTSGATDSFNIQASKQLLTTPRTIVNFPATAGSVWRSSTRKVANYLLSYANASLTNAPGQIVFWTNRKDSVVGWGKMRVYTPTGPSIYYDVLMVRSEQYTIDSFYLGGTPAPTALLSGFQVAQNQQTDSSNRYNFYRANSAAPLMMVNYRNNYFTSPSGMYIDTTHLTPTGINELSNDRYVTMLFPNPTNTREINLQFIGKNLETAAYSIVDMLGRTVQTGTTAVQANTLKLNLNAEVTSGNYLISITDKNQTKIATERFVVQ